MKRVRIIIISIFLVMIIIIGSLAYFITRNNEPEEKEEIPFFEENDCRIYTNHSIISHILNETNFNYTRQVIKFDYSMNESKAIQIAGRYLDEPILEDSSPHLKEYHFKDNRSSDTLFIHKTDVSWQCPRSNTPSLNRIPDVQLKDTAEKKIMEFRGHMDDLRFTRIYTSGSTIVSSNKSYFLGWYSYIIKYNQYIGGVMVGSGKGEITVSINHQNLVKYYRDSTLEIEELEIYDDKVRQPADILSEFCMKIGEGSSYDLREFHLIYDINEGREKGFMKYEVTVNPRTNCPEGKIIQFSV